MNLLRYGSKPSFFTPLLVFATLALGASGTSAADREDFSDFEKHIRPVLVEHCYSCHSSKAEKVKGGLLLDTREGLRRGGDTGPAVVPGNAAKSLILKALRYENFEMPPRGRLPKEVVAKFEEWIARGAADPRGGAAQELKPTVDVEAGRKFWSFQPLRAAAVPQPNQSEWPRNDIDRFVLARLKSKGLRPVADASSSELIRRVSMDLTGLPPTTAEVEEFLRAVGKQSWEGEAFKALVERLLASPRFGERWGRHWLDVARYAESTGGALNVLYPLAFHYRDWVVDAFNADKPYDQFVCEQLAGDLLPARDDGQRNDRLTATGFLTVGVKDLRENDNHRFRMAMADEQIDATSRAFLGLTIACAKCHDHKFDPIPTTDYYALAGIFTSSEPMLAARRNRNRSPLAAGIILKAGTPVSFTDADFAALLAARVDVTYKRLAVRNESWKILDKKGLKAKDIQKHAAMLAAEPSVQKLKAEADAVEERLRTLMAKYDAALPHAIMGMRDVVPADCAVHIRGEDTQLGPVVSRGFPQVLVPSKLAPMPSNQSGRLQLAEWIASPEHPLTARVMANRVWLHLFGVGLVETPDDFGATGQPPSNPELLDHIAGRFIAHGWSVKKLIAEIVQSRAYQLGTGHNAQAYKVDPANRLHWRANRRRLDSDAFFDAVRHISGDLVLTRPASEIRPTPQDDRVKSMDLKAWFAPSARHRTVYQPVLRDHVPDDWKLFDFPDPELVTGVRGVTTVPTQALHLMNSPFIADQSQKTATRLLAEGHKQVVVVREAYIRILNREPLAEETKAAAAFLDAFGGGADASARVAALCQTLFASAEFLYLY